MSTKNKRFWIGIASKEHVKMGMAGGFSQLCHGKAQPLKRMAVGDGLIYYSSKEKFGADALCQQFTAIGEVVGSEVYQFEMFPGFVPYRRDVKRKDCCHYVVSSRCVAFSCRMFRHITQGEKHV